ncbi:hypothetical protein ACSNOK_22780 [Streptomyces sp. URMC 126]|uniref:hypothetical protein n=1 Tax=Streptomyces sp. URMC 126 TaxID=3423401 RepID=UPI003F1CAC20
MTDTPQAPSSPAPPAAAHGGGGGGGGGTGGDGKREQARRMLRDRLRRYLELEAEHGPEHAREALLDGHPERQAALMGPVLAGCSLAEGFGRLVPRFAALGLLSEAVDASTGDEDAVMEVYLTCICLRAARDLGLSEARPVLCELDFEATRRAFPGMTAESLRRQTDGHHVCVFRYARPRSGETGGESGEDAAPDAGGGSRRG